MKITIDPTNRRLVLAPESDAEGDQLNRIVRVLTGEKLKCEVRRQWEIESIIIPLEPDSQ